VVKSKPLWVYDKDPAATTTTTTTKKPEVPITDLKATELVQQLTPNQILQILTEILSGKGQNTGW
jgi:hypothetical protein